MYNIITVILFLFISVPGFGFMIDATVNPCGTPVENQFYTDVTSNGSDYFIIWGQWYSNTLNFVVGDPASSVYGARFSSSGKLLDSIAIPIFPDFHYYQNSTRFHAVGWCGGNYLIAGPGEPVPTGAGIYGVRVSEAGAVLDTNSIPIHLSDGYIYDMDIVSNGTNYLVVWSEIWSFYDSIGIYGVRVTTAGEVLDSTPITISAPGNRQWKVCGASDGNNYFVVWERSYIYGRRINSDGELLDTASIHISKRSWNQKDPAVAWDGTNYMVVWEDYAAGPHIYEARVDTSGKVIDTTAIPICTFSGSSKWSPSISWADSNYLVVWNDSREDRNIYGTRVLSSGTVLDPDGKLIMPLQVPAGCTGYFSISAVSNGGNYLVACEDMTQTSGSWTHIYGVRVNPSDGEVLDSTNILISQDKVNYQIRPCLGWDGTNYFALWLEWKFDDWKICGLRLNPLGEVLDSVPIQIGLASEFREMFNIETGWNGSNYLVSWYQKTGVTSNFNIYGARVSPMGEVLDTLPIGIKTSDAQEGEPSIASDGNNYLVVWKPNPMYAGGGTIYGTIVDSGGVVHSPDITISNTDNCHFSQVVWNDTNYLAVWQNAYYAYEICGARVDTGGVLLDSIPITIIGGTESKGYPKVASNGINSFVAWWFETYASDWNIGGARVSASGNVLDSCISICNKGNPKVVLWNGTNYLVIHDHIYDQDIYATVVTTDGIVLNEFKAVDIGEWPPSPVRHTLSYAAKSDLSGQHFLVYPDSAGAPYNCIRIFGKFFSEVGVTDSLSGKTKLSPYLQLYPNPGCSKTTIEFGVSDVGITIIRIYDIMGRLVATPFKKNITPGSYKVFWDGYSDKGKYLPCGLYFCKLETAGATIIKKLLLLR